MEEIDFSRFKLECPICGKKKGGYEQVSCLGNDKTIWKVCFGECLARFKLGLDRVPEEDKAWLRKYLEERERNGSLQNI